MSVALQKTGRALGSLRLTAVLMAALFLVLVLDAEGVLESEVPRALVFGALAVNLAAVVGRRWRSFVRKPALLAFHGVLLVLVLVGLAGRAVQMERTVQLIEGERARLLAGDARAGPMAPRWLGEVWARLDRVEMRYWRGSDLAASHAELELEVRGERRAVRVAPGEPAIHGSLRVYLLSVAGYAAVFRRTTEGGAEQGAVSFPEYRRYPDGQVESLHLPGAGAPIVCTLDLPSVFREDVEWSLGVPEGTAVELVVPGRDGAVRLGAGEGVLHEGAHLTLLGVRRYARFLVTYDPTRLVAMTLLLLLPVLLVWHYARGRRSRRPARDT